MNNYYPLPEWHPQSATLVVWPHRYSDWSNQLDMINRTYLNLVRTISAYQCVIIIHFNTEHKAAITRLCTQQSINTQQLRFISIETNDTWVRDYGPQILYGSAGYCYVDGEFNAWGEQYPCRLDNLFAEKFFACIDQHRSKYRRCPIALEGGNLEFDSQSNLLTNIACIQRNNPKLSLTQESIIDILRNEFSLKRILAIDVPALAGDDTGGHIDTLARFVDDNTIVFSSTDDTNNANHACLMLLRKQLSALRDKQGSPYKLIPLPLPRKTLLNENNESLPANYVNFIFINRAIVVPLHQDEHDQVAMDRLANACPNRKILGINANDLLQQFGSLHCATLHLPENILTEGV